MLLGGAQLGVSNYADASATFQSAAGMNSRDWLPQYYIGQAQTAAGSYASAVQALQKALSLTEESDDRNRIWKQLGFVYEKLKNFSQAKTAYGKAGDPVGVRRVEENEQTELFNSEIEAEQVEIARLRAKEEALEERLRRLEEGETPPRR